MPNYVASYTRADNSDLQAYPYILLANLRMNLAI